MLKLLVITAIALFSTTACASGADLHIAPEPKISFGRWDIIPTGGMKKFEVRVKTRFF